MEKKNLKTVAIILAAGSGSRMGLSQTKQTLLVDGKSVLRRTLEVFDEASVISSIVIVTKENEFDFVNKECHEIKTPFTIVKGGKTRSESAKLGFLSIPNDTDYVMIHDAARCLITVDEIKSVAEYAYIYGAATASLNINDTLKRCDESGKIIETVNRSELKSVQTPQAFSKVLYEKALNEVQNFDASITDDNMLLENIGVMPYCVETLSTNIKITTKNDLDLAEFILKKREGRI